MKKINVYITVSLLLLFTACKKDGFDGISDSSPAIPVTVSDLYGLYNYPVVSTSFAGGGSITIKLNIPVSSGRTIKEITRVAAGTSGTNYKSVEVTTPLYNTAVIPGNGTSATFTTTLAEYSTKTSTTPYTTATSGTATSFLARYFFFLITLDNGQTIIPSAIRVYVNK